PAFHASSFPTSRLPRITSWPYFRNPFESATPTGPEPSTAILLMSSPPSMWGRVLMHRHQQATRAICFGSTGSRGEVAPQVIGSALRIIEIRMEGMKVSRSPEQHRVRRGLGALEAVEESGEPGETRVFGSAQCLTFAIAEHEADPRDRFRGAAPIRRLGARGVVAAVIALRPGRGRRGRPGAAPPPPAPGGAGPPPP